MADRPEVGTGPAPTGPGIGEAERRAHPRFTLVMKGLAEHAKLVGAGAIEVVASNISAAGMLLHTDRGDMLAEHDIMVLSFTPLRDGELFHLAVRVLWIQQGISKEMGRTSFGCAFIDTPADRIRKLLDPAREAAALRGLDQPY